ncbi:MAG: ATP-binding protein [Flavobacteriales bacterium]
MNILGQEDNINRYIQSVQNEHVAHAQFIADRHGAGGFAFAWAMSKYILCEQRTEKDACGKCQSCKMVSNLAHPDLHFSFPVAKDSASKSASCRDFLATWREMMLENPYSDLEQWVNVANFQKKQTQIDIKEGQQILRDLNLKSFLGEYKVLIVWCPEKMNVQASNKMLKFIEEPMGKTLLLFVGTRMEDILPTLQSRMQCSNLRPLQPQIVENYLMENHQTSIEQAKSIANISDGNLSLAIHWVANSEDIDLYSLTFVEWVRLCFQALKKQKLNLMVQWVNDISKLGREKQIAFLEFAMEYFRKAFLENYQMSELSHFELKDVTFNIQNFCPFVHAQNCVNIIEEIELACKQINQNANSKIVFLDLSFKVARNLHKKLNVEQYGV